jgi:hypothetical protein
MNATSNVNTFTTVNLPEGWQVRTRGDFHTIFDIDAEAVGVEASFLASLRTDVARTLSAAEHYGLVMLAAYLESIDPEPVDLDVEDLEVPFSADEIAPVAIAATLSVLQQGRPEGGPEELLAALDEATGRWLSEHELVDLPVGPAVLTREMTAIHPPTLKQASDVLLVTYHVFPSDAPELMIVAMFRTPSLGFATDFDELFAAIASTIEMVELDDADAAALAAGPLTPEP